MTKTSPRLSPRQLYRAQVTDQIIDAAEAQVARQGADALSLRGIARQLGMAPSAIHRYFASRDELLATLAGRGSGSLGAALDAADAGVALRTDYAGRARAVLQAQWSWAAKHTQTWALLFANPASDPAAGAGSTAAEQGSDAAQRFVRAMVRIVSDARAAGRTMTPGRAALVVASEALPTVPGVTDTIPRWQLATALAAYAWSCGAVQSRANGFVSGFVADPDALYKAGVDHWVEALGL